MSNLDYLNSEFTTENMEDFKENFELVNADTKIFDTKFDTKPTTYFKDAFKRFCKNKSSVAGAIILGILILLAIFVPVVSTYNIEDPAIKEKMLAPKLFEAGTGFWDGTIERKNIVVDTTTNQPADTYLPAVSSLKVDANPSYINTAHKYAKGGYLHFYNATAPIEIPEDMTEADFTETEIYGLAYLSSYPTTMTSTGGYKAVIEFGNEDGINGAQIGEYRIVLYYIEGETQYSILLQDFSRNYETTTINISEALAAANLTEVKKASLAFELKGAGFDEDGLKVDTYLLIKTVKFTADQHTAPEDLNLISMNDANQSALYTKDLETNKFPVGYWTSTGNKNIYQTQVYFCSFTYDTYLAAYDSYEKTLAYSTVMDYVKAGWLKFKVVDAAAGVYTWEIKDADNCPIEEITGIKLNKFGDVSDVYVKVARYKEYGYKTMPKFLFGTDVQGHDLVKKAFTGLRTSLILGVCTFLFCFAFGLCWGAISGYFGGNVDLAMERFCEILGGVPWIVIMTLAILHFGNNFLTFFMALCLTGWMGTAGRTRTQFYRFKGREYVLASRTLGASDGRLIFRHILPNALGTIVTGAVLMIPSVIFSESTLAYLNLGLQGVQSFGVMLSDNQKYIETDPHLIAFPAAVLALIMISFNLFGNGLRDALNPSLKGSE